MSNPMELQVLAMGRMALERNEADQRRRECVGACERWRAQAQRDGGVLRRMLAQGVHNYRDYHGENPGCPVWEWLGLTEAEYWELMTDERPFS